jgi:hypothetical protein
MTEILIAGAVCSVLGDKRTATPSAAKMAQTAIADRLFLDTDSS